MPHNNVGTSFNTSDDASTPAAIPIGSTTAVTVKPSSNLDDPHFEYMIYNDGNQILWLRKYAASTDNLKKGEPIFPGEKSVFLLPNMVVSEWSAIFNSGGTRDVYTQLA